MRSTAFAFTAALAPAACIGGGAWAQSYPSKPVTVISALPPGNNDVNVRLVDGPFQAAFKQPRIIENRPGAGGNIAAEAVSRAVPDGHTLLVTVGTVATAYLANSAQTLVCHPLVSSRCRNWWPTPNHTTWRMHQGDRACLATWRPRCSSPPRACANRLALKADCPKDARALRLPKRSG